MQVLDDSDCTNTRDLVDARVAEWRARGADVDLIRRTHRQGYKAGALQAGNQLVADKGYQYVAIFDADFRPHPDFLMKTVGYLEANEDVALVQVCAVLCACFSQPCTHTTPTHPTLFYTPSDALGVYQRRAVTAHQGTANCAQLPLQV